MNFPQDATDFSDTYEYGVWLNGADTSDLHRWGMTEAEAVEWVREWEEEIAPQAKPNLFVVCRRPVGKWQVDLDGEFVEFERE